MNCGLRVATGRYVAFCNNDTVLPPRWASRLVETADAHPRAGIVVPALTAAGDPGHRSHRAGRDVVVLRALLGAAAGGACT